MPYLEKWKKENETIGHNIDILHKSKFLLSGDILFLISCIEKIDKKIRCLFKHVLVLHASDLPIGRGWSPYIWEILNGSEQITLSLINAEDDIDTGKVWKKSKISVPKYFLWDEINHVLFTGELDLMSWAIENHKKVVPDEQDKTRQATYWPRRTANDSMINIEKSFSSQFNLIRVCDPKRYPAFCEIEGRKYKLILERLDDETY